MTEYKLGLGAGEFTAHELIKSAIEDLHNARAKLKAAGAKRAHAYVNRALKSVEGAQRHAERSDIRQARAAGITSRSGTRRFLKVIEQEGRRWK